jgi:hypothetical protein
MTLIQLIRTICWLKSLGDPSTSRDDGAHGASPSVPQPHEAAAMNRGPVAGLRVGRFVAEGAVSERVLHRLPVD